MPRHDRVRAPTLVAVGHLPKLRTSSACPPSLGDSAREPPAGPERSAMRRAGRCARCGGLARQAPEGRAVAARTGAQPRGHWRRARGCKLAAKGSGSRLKCVAPRAQNFPGAGKSPGSHPIPAGLLFAHCNSVATARWLCFPKVGASTSEPHFLAPAMANWFETSFSRRGKKRIK